MVIDELIVTLGLDASKFNEGERAAVDSFRRLHEGVEQTSKRVEAQGAKMSEVFGIARKGAMGLIAAFIGGEAASFIEHVVGMDAVSGRFAKTIGTSVENLALWQSMVRQVGGNAEDATGALQGLQGALNNFRFGNGQLPAPLAFLLNQMPGGLGNKNADQVLRGLQGYFTGEINSGRMTSDQAATQMSWIPGMNQNVINLMLDDFKKIEEAAKKVGGATDESAAGAQKLQAAFSLLLQAVERTTAALTPLFNIISKPMNEITKKDAAGLLPEVTFDKGSVMDRLDTWLWGEYGQHEMGGGSGGATPGKRASAGERETWIRTIAQGLNIDPQVALRVAKSEGFNGYQSSIPGEQSFGDFQLNMIKGNLGDVFQKQTGLDPRDPANEKMMDEFALKWVSTHGWGAFHGAKNTGIGAFEGIGARSSAGSRVNNNRSSSSSSTSTTHIGKVEVNTQATDAAGIAADIAPAIKYASLTAPANSGLT